MRRGVGNILLALLVAAALAPAASQAAPEQPLELAKVGFKLEGVADDGAGFVVRVGDFDGDGIVDLAVGAPCESTNAANAGAVYILYGPITPERSLAEADVTLLGTWAGGFAGEFLAVLDMDGDGADELVVGVPGPFVGGGVFLEPVADSCFGFGPVQPGVNQPGEAYVVGGGQRLSGALDLDTVANTVITGLAPMDFTSFDLGGADLDGDGRDELVVGAAGPGAVTGVAHLFSGDLPTSTSVLDSDAQLVGEQPADAFGYRIAGGDVDGDGNDDLLIAAPGALHSARTGRVHVFLGGTLPAGPVHATAADIVLEGFEPGDRAGVDLLVVDLDGDGFDDIVVGARVPGITSVFYGPLTERGRVPLDDADVHVHAGEGRHAGWALAVADLHGNGQKTLAIGADGDTSGGESAGAVHLLDSELSGEVDAGSVGSLLVGAEGDLAGFALAAGDITGNGNDDLVVAAPALFTAGKPGGVYIVPRPAWRHLAAAGRVPRVRAQSALPSSLA